METGRSEAEVLEAVAAMIREVIGDDGGLGPPIALETSFHDDLELESIEFVALAEKLEVRWGRRVDLAGWLAGKSIDAILALRVGDLVELVTKCP
jgi:acyl carrier protein